MNCPDLDLLEAFASEALDGSARSGVEAHLADCEPCRALLAEVRSNLRVLRPISGMLRCAELWGELASSERFVAGFRLLRELGRGGSGVVYEAEQQNPRRNVALKLLRADAGPADGRSFRRETRALARLQHPGIAALHASGRTPEGAYYLAMERVAGLALTDHVSRARLALDQCLVLFGEVCDAVDYAHRRGVIHRDLKPSNILVTEAAPHHPKVLDFGLASILDPEEQEGGEPLTFTEPGTFAGTLQYTSPEQARGERAAISSATDVYALGVILFELTTGRLPYALERANVPAAIRIICEQAPERPRKLRPELPRDLETILLTALEKEPARRYWSVAAFADDVRRLSSHEPIVAHPPSTFYVARKFARRHRALVGGAAAVFITLTAGLATTTLQARELEQSRNDEQDAKLAAQRDAAIAREAHDLLRGTLAAANPLSYASLDELPHDVRVVDALDRAAALLEHGTRDPLVSAVVDDVLANTSIGLADLERALRHAERAYSSRSNGLGPAARPTLESLYVLATTRFWRLELDEARRLFEAGLTLAQSHLGEDDLQSLRFAAGLGRVALQQGRLQDAEIAFAELVARLERTAGRGAPDTIAALRTLGLVRHARGEFASADALLTEALELASRELGREHPTTTSVASVLAAVRDRLGRPGEADELRARVLEQRRRALGDEHPQTIEALNNFAVGKYKRGLHAEAEELFRQTLELRRRVLGDDNPGVMVTENNLAAVCLALGRPAEAESFARSAAEGARVHLAPTDWQRGVYLKRLGECLVALERFDEAEAALLEAHTHLLANLGPRHDATKKTVDTIVALYVSAGRLEEAERWRNPDGTR